MTLSAYHFYIFVAYGFFIATAEGDERLGRAVGKRWKKGMPRINMQISLTSQRAYVGYQGGGQHIVFNILHCDFIISWKNNRSCHMGWILFPLTGTSLYPGRKTHKWNVLGVYILSEFHLSTVKRKQTLNSLPQIWLKLLKNGWVWVVQSSMGTWD